MVGNNHPNRSKSKWRPIETAPKGGEQILTWGYLRDDGKFFGDTPRPQISRWDSETGSWVSFELGVHSPTHWAPIPPSP